MVLTRPKSILFYLALYFLLGAITLRALLTYFSTADPLRWVVAGLLLAFAGLMSSERWLTRRYRRYPCLYLAWQTSLGLILLLLPPYLDFFAALFIPLSAQAMLFFSQRTGLGWLIIGYLLVADTRFEQAIRRHHFAAIVLAGLTTTVGLILYTSKDPVYGSPDYILLNALRVFNSWFWLLAILGLGQRYFNFNNNFLAYTSAASLLFYILHQTVIVVIGFFLMDWSLGVLPKYLILAVTSFAIIMTLYELLIKRFNGLRFLFGLKSRQPAHTAPATRLEEKAV